jgi:hypothetical protein
MSLGGFLGLRGLRWRDPQPSLDLKCLFDAAVTAVSRQPTTLVPADDAGVCDARHSASGDVRAACLQCNPKGRAMNMHVDVRDFNQSSEPKKPGLLRRMLAFIASLMSGSKGDQGGWESGARGF